MKNDAKKTYENMVDYKRFATILLAVGAFIYLGLIIPFDKSASDQYLMVGASLTLLIISTFLFIRSKILYNKLQQMEEADQYLSKK